ncbi:MAG: hypothetical protein H6713_36685 [Myxococcales bacterium]|nr:hypothetical protein [Myxococcales bacterium]
MSAAARTASRVLGSRALALVPLSIALALTSPQVAGAREGPRTPEPATAASEPETTAQEPPPRRGDPRPRRGFAACNPGSDPCTRSRPARLLLALTGVVLSGAGTAIFLTLGDSVGAGDPGGVMVGAGFTALTGAAIGSIFALVDHDLPTDFDRVRPAPLELGYGFGPRPAVGERRPGTLRMRFAPTYWITPGARVRLLGHVGGLAGEAVDVDPRPQAAEPSGEFATAQRERRLDVGVALDTAVALPYPVLPATRSAFLGRAELRWKPEAQIRRHTYNHGAANEELQERVMFLPLTVGARWSVSSRQRLTVYAGPRFDFSAHRRADGPMRRGAPSIGPFYGEAWYEVDVPLATRAGRTRVNSQLALGYVHSRFDGRGINVDAVIGFMGPVHLRWVTRVRPPGARFAAQAGAGLILGDGATVTLSVGVVMPDAGAAPARRRPSSEGSR